VAPHEAVSELRLATLVPPIWSASVYVVLGGGAGLLVAVPPEVAVELPVAEGAGEVVGQAVGSQANWNWKL
jgi:hypothetical protein